MAKKSKSGRDLHGLLVLDKPLGLSSNHALQRVKRLLNAKKVGHTGTLDPLATGALVLCFGRATKMADHVTEADKTYHVVAKLGEQTETGDQEGQITNRQNVTQEHLDRLVSVVQGFVGKIEQLPPMYSALKKDGVPLYKLAREGKSVPRTPRFVQIHSIEINGVDGDRVGMKVTCTKGTYIRTLVEDIGAKLGCYAHVAELRRLSVGHFGERYPMIDIDALERYGNQPAYNVQRMLLPIETAFLDYPVYQMKNALILALEQGMALKYPPKVKCPHIRIYDTDQVLRGLGTRNSHNNIDFNRQISQVL